MNGSTITVTGSLTHEAPVATITPASYSEEVRVLDGDFVDSESGKFNVTKEEDKQWFIHRGYLTDKYVINANNENVDIKDPSKPYVITGSQIGKGQVNITLENDDKGVDYDITLSSFTCDAPMWGSALILDNKLTKSNSVANFKITLEVQPNCMDITTVVLNLQVWVVARKAMSFLTQIKAKKLLLNLLTNMVEQFCRWNVSQECLVLQMGVLL